MCRPSVSVTLIAFITVTLIQSGGLASADASRRLQVAHAFWTSAPPVLPQDYPDFGIPGRGGVIHAWYGMGQSLVMLPGDVLGTFVSKRFAPAMQDRARALVVAYLTFPLLNALAVLAAFNMVRALGFDESVSALASLGLLGLTSFLHYAQVAQENNLILLLTLWAYVGTIHWLRTARPGWIALAACAVGFNLLIRLPTAIDAMTIAFFAGCVLFLARTRIMNPNEWPLEFRRRLTQVVLIALPIVSAAGGVDRLYHYHRFGTFRGTYIHLYGEEVRRQHPSAPAQYPFNNPFLDGFVGPLFSAEKSIFLFDPLLPLSVALIVWKRRHLPPIVTIALLSALLGLIITITFYARLVFWGGGVAWGNRYTTVPVHVCCLLGLVAAAHLWRQLPRLARIACLLLFSLSLTVQISSIALEPAFEAAQAECWKKPVLVVSQRLVNLFALAGGNVDEWHLGCNGYLNTERARTLNFTPFVMQRFFSKSISHTLACAWMAAVCLLAVGVHRFLRRIVMNHP